MLKNILLLLGVILTAGLSQSSPAVQTGVVEESEIFGENPTLRHLMEEGLSFRKDMTRTREAYLKLYEEQFQRTALEARVRAERALDSERNGYEAGIAWNLLDNGFFGSRSDAREKRLQKSISFEQDMDSVLSNYAEVAYFEIEDIKRALQYRYAGKRFSLLDKGVQQAQKMLRSGLLTRFAFERIETAYEKSRNAQNYFFVSEPKLFDSKYRKLISQIESKRLIDVEKLKKLALRHAPSVRMEKKRLEQATHGDAWQQHIKAELYLERKEYTFVDRRETLGGIQMRIPLEHYAKDAELVKLEKIYSHQKLKSLELILGKRVEYLYGKLSYYKEQIDRLQREYALGKRQLEQYRYKVSHPAGERMMGSWEQMLMAEANLLDLERDIWIKRADILAALLKLQYLSGVRLLR